jgi:hypothetical protein
MQSLLNLKTQVTKHQIVKPLHIAPNMLALVLNVLFIETCINNACVTVYVLYLPSKLAMEKR